MKKIFLYFLFISSYISHVKTYNYNIIAFGDSHIIFGFRPAIEHIKEIFQDPTFSFRPLSNEKSISFHLNWLHGKTLHGISKVNFDALFDKHKTIPYDAILFSFGEIDVRCHIAKQAFKQNRTIQSIIDELVINFYNHLDNFRRSNNITVPFIVMSPIPPINSPGIENPEVPFHGNQDERAHISQLLRESLAIHLLPCMFIFNPYTPHTHNGLLLHKFSDNHVHFNPFHNHSIIEQLYTFLNSMNCSITDTKYIPTRTSRIPLQSPDHYKQLELYYLTHGYIE